MKPLLYLLLVAALLTAAGCECEKYKCPAFGDLNDRDWLPRGSKSVYSSGSSGPAVSFAINSKDLSGTYGEDETVISFSCKQNDCFASAAVSAVAEKGGPGGNLALAIDISSSYLKKDLIASRLEYTLGDMSAGFPVEPSLPAAGTINSPVLYADSILDVNTGTRIYPGVLVQTRKPQPGAFILKTYWYKGSGLIGFADSSGRHYWLQ